MFIDRRPDRSIYGAWSVRQWQGQEELADNDPELVAFLSPKPPIDQSDIDNLDKALKAISLLMRQYVNALRAGTFVVKSIADVRSDLMTIYRALP
jgi:hypothetical protein